MIIFAHKISKNNEKIRYYIPDSSYNHQRTCRAEGKRFASDPTDSAHRTHELSS